MQSTPARFFVDDDLPTVAGELDVSNSDCLRDWLVSFGPGPLNVDFSSVNFIDATALRSVLRVQRLNPRLRIINPSWQVQRVLDLTHTTLSLTNDR